MGNVKRNGGWGMKNEEWGKEYEGNIGCGGVPLHTTHPPPLGCAPPP